MKLEDQIYKSITEYPSLFYYTGHPTLSDFEISRLAVLEHLFMTNGNGYCWVDGYMCEMEDAIDTDFEWPLGWTAEGPKYGVLTYPGRVFPPARTGDLFAYEYFYMQDRPAEWPFSIYNISDSYTLMFPELVQPDWLAGAKDICEFAIRFFESKNALDGNNKKISYKERQRSLKHLKAKLVEINQRLSDVGNS